jgi:hypothetical protein
MKKKFSDNTAQFCKDYAMGASVASVARFGGITPAKAGYLHRNNPALLRCICMAYTAVNHRKVVVKAVEP